MTLFYTNLFYTNLICSIICFSILIKANKPLNYLVLTLISLIWPIILLIYLWLKLLDRIDDGNYYNERRD